MLAIIYFAIIESVLYESLYVAINIIYKVFNPPIIVDNYTEHILNYWIEINDNIANIIHIILLLAINMIGITYISTILLVFSLIFAAGFYILVNYIHDLIMIAISNIVIYNYKCNQNLVLIYMIYRQLKSANSSCIICYSDADEIHGKYIVKFKCGHEYCPSCVNICKFINIQLRCPACTQLIL